VVGKKNVGKGTVLSHLAARVTRGELGENRNVIWISAGEDSLGLDVRPRIEAAGGDSSRVYGPSFIPKLPTEVLLLQKWAEELGNVGLIVLDPVSGMLPARSNSNMDTDVRPAIAPLNEVADALQCLIVGVRHLKKDASRGALESVLGSTDWVNVPRAVLAIVVDEDDVHYIQVVAGNRIPNGSSSRVFRIVGADIVPGGEPVALAKFLDGPGRDVDEILREDAPTANVSRTKQAMAGIILALGRSARTRTGIRGANRRDSLETRPLHPERKKRKNGPQRTWIDRLCPHQRRNGQSPTMERPTHQRPNPG